MIGISVLIGLALWGALAVWISKRIPRWAGIAKHTTAVSVLVFPFVFLAPVVDELIGRWQFHQLCEREAVVWLSPDWRMVKRAGRRNIPIVTLSGYLIRIQSQRLEYFDVDTGENFLVNQAFHADGGILIYKLGLGLGGSTACWPVNDDQIYRQVNLEKLLVQGKAK